MADLNLTADPITISLSISNLFSSYPSTPRDTSLDQVFYCNYTDVHGNEDAGIPVLTVSIVGTWLNKVFGGNDSDAIITIPLTIASEAAYVEAVHITADTVINITLSIIPDNTDVSFSDFRNWVAWSQIGKLDFDISRGNVEGRRPFDWRGWCRGLLKLGGKVVAYGENGVSFLNPSGKFFGLKTIHRIGTKGKHAFTGDDDIHFFIDAEGRLFRIAGELEKLDYSEYLSSLKTSVVMSYDPESELVYICDGTIGFVFSSADNSLGSGPINITGMGAQDGTLRVVAPATITTPNFEICTDIYDLGSRATKTVQMVEFGTDTDKTLYGAIDHRKEISASWSTTPWKALHGSGVLWQTAHGREFRFKLKTTEYEYMELDYVRISGIIHKN